MATMRGLAIAAALAAPIACRSEHDCDNCCTTPNIFSAVLEQQRTTPDPVQPPPPAMVVSITSDAAARDLELVVYEQTEAFGKPPAPPLARIDVPALPAGGECAIAVPRFDVSLCVELASKQSSWSGVVGYANRFTENASRTALVGPNSLRGRVVGEDGRPAAARVWVYPARLHDRSILRWTDTDFGAPRVPREEAWTQWTPPPYANERVQASQLPTVSALTDSEGRFEFTALPGDAALVHVRVPTTDAALLERARMDPFWANAPQPLTRDSARWTEFDAAHQAEVEIDFASEIAQPLHVASLVPLAESDAWNFEVQVKLGSRWAECLFETDFPGSYQNSTQELPALPRIPHRIRAIRAWGGAVAGWSEEDLLATIPHSPWIEFVPGEHESPLELRVSHDTQPRLQPSGAR